MSAAHDAPACSCGPRPCRCQQEGRLAALDYLIHDSLHRAAPRGVGSTKAAGNYSPCLVAQAQARTQVRPGGAGWTRMRAGGGEGAALAGHGLRVRWGWPQAWSRPRQRDLRRAVKAVARSLRAWFLVPCLQGCHDCIFLDART
jgi:hypothetical protein